MRRRKRMMRISTGTFASISKERHMTTSTAECCRRKRDMRRCASSAT